MLYTHIKMSDKLKTLKITIMPNKNIFNQIKKYESIQMYQFSCCSG